MSRILLPLVSLAAVLLGSCTALTQFDDLRFDDDPCAPPPPGGCTGGSTIVLIGRGIRINRADALGRRDGFDLDATAETICGEADVVAPDGENGIDTNLSPILEAYEQLENVDIEALLREAVLRGENLGLVILEHVDAGTDDACVELTQRTAVLPVGMSVADLDADGDGILDPGLTFDYLASAQRSTSACVIDGVVHARLPPQATFLPGTTTEATARNVRARLTLPASGPPSEMLIGGSLELDGVTGAFAGPVADYLRQHADVRPSHWGADDCREMSFALWVDLAPAVLGVARSP